MIEGIPRISVRIITYKQEELIKRAIESLLSQKDYIYEICVSDDCSPDKTWEVLQEYSAKYPGLFKLNRNDPNLGIFENIEKSWTMPTGDIVYSCAGDDECGPDWFKAVVEFIQQNNIDYKNELFCIYGNYQNRYPSGDSYVFRNDLINKKDVPAIKLSHRGLIGNRSTCYSINVMRKYQKLSKGKSHIAESAIDRQLQIFSEKNYYIDKVGNIYYANIGVCVNMSEKDRKEREQIWPYTKQFFDQCGVQLDKKDLIYGEYIQACDKNDGSLKNKIKCAWLFLKSYDPKIGVRCLRIKRSLFAIARRLPHRKPIHWN